MVNEKRCFIISPIGDVDSKVRKYADNVMNYIIRPTCEEYGYKSIRADEISESGMINTQIISHLVKDDLVIADLTGLNPNVFYELAVRHAKYKPIIHMRNPNEKIPFDLIQARAIPFDITDVSSVEPCKEQLGQYIKNVEENPDECHSPISQSLLTLEYTESSNPQEQEYGKVLLELEAIRNLLKQKNIKGERSGYMRPVTEVTSGVVTVPSVGFVSVPPVSISAVGVTSTSNSKEIGYSISSILNRVISMLSGTVQYSSVRDELQEVYRLVDVLVDRAMY